MITLNKAKREDCPLLHRLQVTSFLPLLEKYRDHETNPAAESLDRILERFAQPYTTYYLIRNTDQFVGMLRVCDYGDHCLLSPICILPEFQGRGYATEAVMAMEKRYPNAKSWELDTILQERKLCCLYEKLGYVRTGEYRHIKDGMDLVYYRKIL